MLSEVPRHLFGLYGRASRITDAVMEQGERAPLVDTVSSVVERGEVGAAAAFDRRPVWQRMLIATTAICLASVAGIGLGKGGAS